MRSLLRLTPAVVVLAVVFLSAVRARAADKAETDDERVLKRAGVGSESADLLAYFRKRAPSDAARHHMAVLVARLGDKAYRVREKAEKDLIELGCGALPELRRAARGSDLEVRNRARKCIARIEEVGTAVPVAAARLLALRGPDDACAVLLAFLPFAGDETVEQAIVAALATVGFRKGAADPTLAADLKSPQPLRRGAAAFLLGRHGTAAERTVAHSLLADADLAVRFHAAHGLLLGKDTRGVPALIAMLEEGPLELARQAENLLAGASRADAPELMLDAKNRRHVREAWSAWWQASGASADLAQVQKEFHLAGLGRASAVARQALQSLRAIDADAFRGAIALPLYMPKIAQGKGQVESDGPIDTMFRVLATPHFKEFMTGLSYKITRVGRVDEYLKIAGSEETRFLAQLPSSRLLIVYAQVYSQGERASEGCVMVRVSAGRAVVVGFGQASNP